MALEFVIIQEILVITLSKCLNLNVSEKNNDIRGSMILKSDNQIPKIVTNFDVLFPFPRAFFKVSPFKDIPAKEGKC